MIYLVSSSPKKGEREPLECQHSILHLTDISHQGSMLLQVKLAITVVPQEGMVNAATFQKDVQVDLQVLQIPPQLRRLEFARITPSGNPILAVCCIDSSNNTNIYTMPCTKHVKEASP